MNLQWTGYGRVAVFEGHDQLVAAYVETLRSWSQDPRFVSVGQHEVATVPQQSLGQDRAFALQATPVEREFDFIELKSRISPFSTPMILAGPLT